MQKTDSTELNSADDCIGQPN